jgi:hypothetical protein
MILQSRHQLLRKYSLKVFYFVPDSCTFRKGTVGPIRSRVRGPKPRRDPKKPKTAEELDKELDAFMGDAEPASASAAPATTGQEDVEMS